MASDLFKAILLGQFLALLIATTASSSTALARSSISFPALQSAANYLLLALVYGGVRLLRGTSRTLARPWWQYALLAVLDVEANFLVVTAFRFTSVTSVTLLDCWSIPVALALTRLLSLAAYRKGHYGGAALCVLGLAVLVATDEQTGGSGGEVGSAVVLGDVLVVLGASLYAGCNVLQEHLLGDVDPAELLSMLGIFGLVLSLVQGLPLELPTALHAPWKLSSIGPWIGYGMAMFSFYSLVPYELEWGGAAILNLSLLSSDLWTAMARLVFFGGFSAWSALSFGVAFIFVAAGIALYTQTGEVKRSVDGGAAEMTMGLGREHRYKRILTGISHDDDYVIAEEGTGEGTSGVLDSTGVGGDDEILRKDREIAVRGSQDENLSMELVSTPPGNRRRAREAGMSKDGAGCREQESRPAEVFR